MTAVLFLLLYLGGGLMIVRLLLPGHKPLTRIWLGLCLGLMLFMWLPALLAFFFKFSAAAHWLSLILLALVIGISFLFRDKRPARGWDEEETKFLKILLWVALPLTLLGGYLQYTHNIRAAADGTYHVGQSTYGDLPLHLGIVTSLRDAAFPPDYSILPGELLSYPFLMDSLSTSLYLFGFSLQLSLLVPGTLMMALCFAGYLLLAREAAGSKRACILAALFFFLNGGLGFLYNFDLSAGDVGERLKQIMEGYYQTPTNQPEPYNLRWSNVIADLMIPQRTILGGWCMVLPLLYLLYTAFAPHRQEEHPANYRQLLLLGVWAGGMPLLHTHSFLALGLISLGFLGYTLLHAKSENRLQVFLPWLFYGAIAVLLAAPQLFTWTFTQSAGSDHFLQFQFNWVNNPGNGGMIDLYLWFYLKNVGLPVILLLCALVEKNPRHRFLAAGAFCIFIAAELIRFQPNEYDNNKLFYIWYILCAILAADYAVTLFDRLRGLRGRYVLAGFATLCFFASAGLTLAREVVSDYQSFSKQDIEAAAYIEVNTPQHAVFMTGYQQHLNPVSALAGRTIVCGPDLWLYFHGFSTQDRHLDIARFYQDPANNLDVLKKYQVEYILISSYERTNFLIDYEGIEKLFPLCYSGDTGEISIFYVPGSVLDNLPEG